jgi:hypothetical protein
LRSAEPSSYVAHYRVELASNPEFARTTQEYFHACILRVDVLNRNLARVIGMENRTVGETPSPPAGTDVVGFLSWLRLDVGLPDVFTFCCSSQPAAWQSALQSLIVARTYKRRVTVYRLSRAVRSAHTKDGATVLDIAQGHMFSLNPVGSRILELLAQQFTRAQIVEEIVRNFGATRALVETDIDDFLGRLKELKLVEELPISSRVAEE